MKVYIITEAKLFQPERYITIRKSLKEAEKVMRGISPHMRPAESMKGLPSYWTDASKQCLFFVHEEEI